jgi:cyclic di-GMP phosphodiesterase
MLKRVPVDSLTVGMYIHELGGAWLDHPFWRTSFKIENPDVLRRILDSGVREAWIDTTRGLDVAGGISQEQSDAEVEQELVRSASEPSPVEHVPMEKEVARAGKTLAKSCEALADLFQQVRMGRALQDGSILPVVDDIAASVMRNAGVLTALARMRRQDNYTFMHSISVCALMVAVGNQLGFSGDQAREAGLAGLLHDIGKILIDAELLNKKGPLTDEEFAALRRHPQIGHDILATRRAAGDVVLDVCLHHHERIDGSGYPGKLAGEKIGLHARLAAVCDVYDATTSNRPYKDVWPPAHALRKMTEWSSNHFDQRLFHAFVRTVGIYPIGTLVRLKSDRLAVVVDQSEGSLLTPRVKVFFSIAANHRVSPKVLDLSRADAADEIVSHEDPDAWGIDDINFLWSGIDG